MSTTTTSLGVEVTLYPRGDWVLEVTGGTLEQQDAIYMALDALRATDLHAPGSDYCDESAQKDGAHWPEDCEVTQDDLDAAREERDDAHRAVEALHLEHHDNYPIRLCRHQVCRDLAWREDQ